MPTPAIPNAGRGAGPREPVAYCCRERGIPMPTPTLQLSHRPQDGQHRVEIALDGIRGRQAATADFGFALTDEDAEAIRWYLEEYLQYPVDPAPSIAARVERRLTEIGTELFRSIFEGDADAIRIWNTVGPHLAETRVEVVTGLEEAASIPWELLCDPTTTVPVALRVRSFVRAHPHAAAAPDVPEQQETLRVLLVICRPGAEQDVPFRSVASHLVRLSRQARERLQLDVLRPPTYAQLARHLRAASASGLPYHVVHFDGHGTYADDAAAAANGIPLLSRPRGGDHGFLLFEYPSDRMNRQLVDGPALGALLVETDVHVLVLNACRSAHAGIVTAPTPAETDAHSRVRAYGSLALEVADAGVAGVVAMRYNVYVVTAASFVGELYGALLAGQDLGGAVSAARKQLAADPQREIGLDPRPLQDWLVPLAYETTPLRLSAPQAGGLKIRLSQADAAPERAQLDPTLPADPDVGFFGRDETLLALDRAFDADRIVLLHAWAGSGKTSTAAEFARWYAYTGGIGGGPVLFTSFQQHRPLARVLDDMGQHFAPALEGAGVHWYALGDAERRDVALQVLEQVPVLWIWDNVEPIAGFPPGTESEWSAAEQQELVAFLRDARNTQSRILLTSRREEQAWLGELPRRVALPPMPALERIELARAVAAKRGRKLAYVEDWRPLLDFTQGNPLTVTILVGQALRENLRTKPEIEQFVERLRGGAAEISDDAAQGRTKSLGASLSYGFEHAFDERDRKRLALLHLFQGFVDVDALRTMGATERPVAALVELSREEGIALLDRAAEVGLLRSVGGGYYTIHPALPWYFADLFATHYSGEEAEEAMVAYVDAMSVLSAFYIRSYAEGGTHVVAVLAQEEENLLRACALAQEYGWYDTIFVSLNALRVLYEHMGRTGAWARLVDGLAPAFVDEATLQPLPGREAAFPLIMSFRAGIAVDKRDWPQAVRLSRAAANALGKHVPPEVVDASSAVPEDARVAVAAYAETLLALGRALLEHGDPEAATQLEKALDLFTRVGDRVEGVVFASATLGIASRRAGNLDEAEEWTRRALENVRPTDRMTRGRVLSQLGSILAERVALAGENTPVDDVRGHFRRGIEAVTEALELLPEDAPSLLAIAHNEYGNLLQSAGLRAESIVQYQASIRNEELAGNPFGAAQTQLNLALGERDAGNLAVAIAYAQAALANFESVGVGASRQIERTLELIADIEKDLAEQGA
jgi:tetratricopeptide (TPR) repeat protein